MLAYDVECDNTSGGDLEVEKVSIFSVHIHYSPTTDEFWGSCIDSGAQQNVIRKMQADVFITQTEDVSEISQSSEINPKIFKFDDNSLKCNGVLHVRMPVADDVVIKFDALIVPIHILYCWAWMYFKT